MKGCGEAFFWAVIGGLVGAFVITILGWQYMSATRPGFSTDGQSAMIVFATVPTGGMFGAVVGFGLGLWRGNKTP